MKRTIHSALILYMIFLSYFPSISLSRADISELHWLRLVSLDNRINSGNDDAEELNGDGDVYVDSTDLELTYDDYHGGNQTVGLRFANIAIDQGAMIHSAYIQFTVDEADNKNPCNLTFTAETVDDAPPFTTESNNINNRWPRTTARTYWSPPDWNTVDEFGDDQRTTDMSAVIQEIIDRPGWVRGNAIVFIVTGTGRRVAESFEGDPDKAPLLHIEVGPTDMEVNNKDLASLSQDWLKTGQALAGDGDENNVVDLQDLLVLTNSWLCGCDKISSFATASYELYFLCQPKVEDASIRRFDDETTGYFWEYIDELDLNGQINMSEPEQLYDCNEPEYCPYIYLTDEEYRRILAAKTAHSIWLDKNNVLGWKLADYSSEELRGLFDEDNLFSLSGSSYYYMSVVDHSPSEIYTYLLEHELIQVDALSTFFAVFDDLRSDFRHGNTGDENRNSACSLLHALTSYDSWNMRVSRIGCHSSTRIALSMLRSINIPGTATTDGSWFENGHSSAVWPTLEIVMPHGDHIYNGLLRETPSDQFLPTLTFYAENLGTSPCQDNMQCISHRHMSLNAVTFPSTWTLTRCCNPVQYGYESCADYLFDEHSSYLTTEEIDNAAIELEALCGG